MMFINNQEFMKFLSLVGTIFASLTILLNPSPVKEENSESIPSPMVSRTNQTQRATVDLNLLPTTSTTHVYDEFKVHVLINTGKNSVMGTDLFLSYDPKVLSLSKIEPGSFFSDPQVLKEIVDDSLGKIAYGIGSFQASSGQGIVATIFFKTLTPTRVEKTEVAFTQNTDVAILGEKKPLTLLSKPGVYTILK